MEGIQTWRARDRSPECSTSGRNFIESLFAAESYGSKWDRRQATLLTTKLVGLLREREFPCKSWQAFDKAFACAWLTDKQVVVGTKCNQLLLLNADGHRSPHIPPLQRVPLPAAPERPPSAAPQHGLSGVQSALWTIRAQIAEQSSGSSAGSAMEDSETVAGMLARAMVALDDRYMILPSPGPGHFVVANGGVQIANCGIHSISLSPCGTLLASGGADPSDCQIFRVEDRPDGSVALIPSETLVGHSDWIFGSSWVTDRHVVTGSRDKCLKLWSITPESSEPNRRPLRTCKEQNGKVREIQFLDWPQRIASLSVEGTVHFWDAHLNSISSVQLPHRREIVCMAASEALVGVGSQNHVTLLDARERCTAAIIPNLDLNHSVRSLAFADGLLSVGGGRGKINFFDLRAGRYIPSAGPKRDEPRQSRTCHLQTGSGYLLRNQVYLDHFSGLDVRNACYAHAWDPSRSRLLAVGGPLAFGLTGCYMGIWE